MLAGGNSALLRGRALGGRLRSLRGPAGIERWVGAYFFEVFAYRGRVGDNRATVFDQHRNIAGRIERQKFRPALQRVF